MDDLLNNAPCGFLSFADDGTILLLNATLRDLLGHPPGALEGRRVESILSVGGRVFYQTHFFPLLKMRGRAEEIYLSLRAQSGEEVPMLVNAVRRERDGAPVNDCVLVPMRQRSRYEDEILRARKREALLNRVGQALRGSTDPEAIQSAAVTALGEALRVDRCCFTRYDPARDLARVDCDWHRPDLPSLMGEYRISDLDLDLSRLYRRDAPLVIEDVRGSDRLSPRAAERLEALGLRARAGVGLWEDGQIAASLDVAMAAGPRAWTDEEIALIEAVAAQTRAAIQAARVRERERRIAEALQEALRTSLPGKKLPGLDVAEYYEAALQEASVGGDFFDVFSLDKGCFALIVADLSGKGLAAAAQTATVRHMLRTVLYLGTPVAGAVTKLNDLLIDHGLLVGFATLFAGVYDADHGAITYVCGGQEPALLFRAATGEIEELGPTGPVLGGYGEAVFTERRVPLAAGDVLAVFTDGLTEAGPDRRNLLEVTGIAKLLAEIAPAAPTAQAVVSALMAGVRAFATPDGIRDDVCLLVARVE